MIASLAFALAIEATPMPPRWSADCLNELALRAGSTLNFADPDEVQVMKDRADSLWTTANNFVAITQRADDSGALAALAIWEMERRGESPDGATMISARRSDATAMSTLSRYRGTVSSVPACPFPRLDRANDAIEKAVRAKMADLPPILAD